MKLFNKAKAPAKKTYGHAASSRKSLGLGAERKSRKKEV